MRNSTCRYCGKENVHGMGCLQSPTTYHEEAGDADHCIFCGTTYYGRGCLMNPYSELNTLHIHGHGLSEIDNKIHCIYCGALVTTSSSRGQCMLSPTGNHQA